MPETKKVSKEEKVFTLSEKIDFLRNEIKSLESEIKLIHKKSIKANKLLEKADNLYVSDLCKRYGFKGDKMYYIGAATNRIYVAPINEEILNLLPNIDNLNWKEIQKINQYFMKTKN